MRWLLSVFSIFLAASLIGCGPSQPPKVDLFPVKGEVTYDGKPAAGVQVFFFPVSAVAPPVIPKNPSGTTDASGRFTIGTYADGDGAAEGSYKILLYWPDKSEGNREATQDKLLGWYDMAYSKLTARVKTGDNTIPPLQLPLRKTPPTEVEGIPGRN